MLGNLYKGKKPNSKELSFFGFNDENLFLALGKRPIGLLCIEMFQFWRKRYRKLMFKISVTVGQIVISLHLSPPSHFKQKLMAVKEYCNYR